MKNFHHLENARGKRLTAADLGRSDLNQAKKGKA
jgi:hypothetical protein